MDDAREKNKILNGVMESRSIDGLCDDESEVSSSLWNGKNERIG